MASSSSASSYPYPSTVNPASIVSIKLSTDNYSRWETQMLCLLESQDLVGFIDGTIPKPPETISGPSLESSSNGNSTRDAASASSIVNEDYMMWRRSDRLVKGWMLGSLSEDILDSVVGLSTAKDVWEKLRSQGNNFSNYIPLFKAGLAGDWEAAKIILDRDSHAATAIISKPVKYTILHVAVANRKAIHFLENLVQHYLPTEALITLTDYGGWTLLHFAARRGNTKAAEILMKKNPLLLSIKNNDGFLPLHTALGYGHRDTYLYLQSVSCDDHYAGETASQLLTIMIFVEYFDLALDLVKRYPHAAELENPNFPSPLGAIAEKASYFRSGMRLNFLESFIYSCVPVKFENYYDRQYGGDADVENPQTLLHDRVHFLGVCNRLNLMLWDVIELLVPSVKNIRQKKLVHHQAVQLVKCLCEGVISSSDEDPDLSRASKPLTRAAKFGILEVVEVILDILPNTIWSHYENHNICAIAIINRCEKIFNMIFQMTELRETITLTNILHLAGRLAPPHRLNLVSGAALQMQRELQWFKQVGTLLSPIQKEIHNDSGETAAMVFTREHKELVIKGEKWMKDTANSCSIAAALIITMVFAAAITVPGGNKEYNGLPVFYNDPAFLIFAVSDTVSLFMSTTSLLMFLSILTARYEEQDFLHALPKRLVIGLLTLFLSITTMVIAFSTAVYLVFGGRKGWVIIPLAALSCLPITSFVTLQFPLLMDVYFSTYGRGIFGK